MNLSYQQFKAKYGRPSRPTLSPQMREWLANHETDIPLIQYAFQFASHFDLRHEEAGGLLSQYLRERGHG